MRIGDAPLSVLPQSTTAASSRPAASSLAPATSAASGSADGGFLDHVSALVDRLAVQAGATGGAAGGAGNAAGGDPTRDDQVLGLMRDVFGVGPISDLQLDFDYQHGTASALSASGSVGPDGSAASADALAVDATTFAAHGTFTGADGKHYAFTLDYAAVRAEAAHVDASSSPPPASASSSSPADAAGVAPTPPPAPPAWDLASLIGTIAQPQGSAATLIQRLWKLLGIDGGPSGGSPADQAATTAAA